MVLHTFNAGLNSSSTLFLLNLYQLYMEKRGKALSYGFNCLNGFCVFYFLCLHASIVGLQLVITNV
ncbi:hypothetical protein DBR40_11520 [Pedobacter sp. KBW01]|nr:hypothetical protein DBR40_11520 [Pedobacter sp. KBW01]